MKIDAYYQSVNTSRMNADELARLAPVFNQSFFFLSAVSHRGSTLTKNGMRATICDRTVLNFKYLEQQQVSNLII